jgi:hypothetical protein
MHDPPTAFMAPSGIKGAWKIQAVLKKSAKFLEIQGRWSASCNMFLLEFLQPLCTMHNTLWLPASTYGHPGFYPSGRPWSALVGYRWGFL